VNTTGSGSTPGTITYYAGNVTGNPPVGSFAKGIYNSGSTFLKYALNTVS
jgi:hypothetical protein